MTKNRIKSVDWRQNLFSVWLSQFLANAGFTAVMPFIPLFMREVLHIESDQERGFWVAAFTFFGMLSFCLSTPIWGAMADRYGRKIMLLRAYFGNSIIFPFMALAPNIYVLIVIRSAASLFSGTVSAAQALVSAGTPENKQGFALGALSSAVSGGAVVGFLSGGLIVHYFGYTTAFMLCGLMAFVGFMITLLLVREDFVPPLRTPRQSFKLALPQFGTKVYMILGLLLLLTLARRLDEPFLPLLVEKVGGLSQAALHTGLISAGAAGGIIVAGFVVGWLSDRYSPWKLALPAIIVATAMLLAQALASNLVMLGVARFLAGFAAGGLEPLFLSLLSRHTPPTRRGAVFAWAATLRVGGVLVGSLIGGVVICYFSVRAVFVTAALLFPLLLPATRLALKRR